MSCGLEQAFPLSGGSCTTLTVRSGSPGFPHRVCTNSRNHGNRAEKQRVSGRGVGEREREREWKKETGKKEERTRDTEREREERGGQSHVSPACCFPPPWPLHSASLPANRNEDPQSRPPSQPISFQNSQSIPDSLYNPYPETKQRCPETGVLRKAASAQKRHDR